MSTAGAPDCPLSQREQTRNLLIYGANVGLIYLGAPVLYVGMAQAALIDKLGAEPAVANLPSSVYFWTTPLPILVAWFFCAARAHKWVLFTTYLVVALGGTGVTAALFLAPVPRLIIAALVAHAAILGCAFGVVAAFQWEVLGRGVSESRRGRALALAFGAGPVFACLGSVGATLILKGELGPLKVAPLLYPWNFAVLFGATVPLMGLAALLSTGFVIPLPASEPARPPFWAGVFGGFGQFLNYRLIFLAGLALLLVTSGYNVLNNMTLFTREALGAEPEKFVGEQLALRFGFKAVAGLLLGWLLTKTHPKAGMLVTAGFCLASVVWVLTAKGEWFLLSFGLMGVGELFGVYFPNYILGCSPPSRMRRYMAFTSMLYMPAGFSPLLFGLVAQRFDLRTSFVVSVEILIVALLVVQLGLPARPRPRASDMGPSDRAAPGKPGG